MNKIDKLIITYFLLIFNPNFWVCWKVPHKHRFTAVQTRLIGLILKKTNNLKNIK